ncbi:GNAT family N-acetyltransferase [Streptomyces sp. MN03-5084-2B]|nr:GNAT family N-acetyltransferase [Streptomyces sp. MN03-5084-2B]
MRIDTDHHRRLAGLTTAAWDGFAGSRFYSSAGWLGFCAADFGGESAAAVACRDGEPVCVVPYARTSETLFGSYRWQDRLAAAGLPAPDGDGVLVGPREGYQTHFLGAATASPDELADVVARLRTAAGGKPCVAMYVTTDDVLALRRAGVTTTPVLLKADAWIELPDSGWPGWEAGLSKNRRKMVRRDVREFRDAGYRVEQVPLTECWERLGEIASATQRKYGHHTTPDIELKSLRNHAVRMGSAARTVLLYKPDGSLVGFCLYYLWQGTAFLRWVGLDYERLVGGREYFSLCYYAQIERAAELGIRWLHAGVDAEEAKAIRGARFRPLWLVDLTEDSVLAGAGEAIRAHNTGGYAKLKANPVTAEALDEDAWLPFLRP